MIGWCILWLDFKTTRFPWCFEIVEDLGVEMMLGCRLMELTAAVTDHGLNQIYVRVREVAFETKPDGDDLPQATLGFNSEGDFSDMTKLGPICYTAEEAKFRYIDSDHRDHVLPAPKGHYVDREKHSVRNVSMCTRSEDGPYF